MWVQNGLNISSLDCQKTLLDRSNLLLKNLISSLSWFRKRKPRLGYVATAWWRCSSSLFFLAESVLFFLGGEALHQRNLFSNSKNHFFRKRSTWALLQLSGYCLFGVSWKHYTWLDVILCLPILHELILNWIKVSVLLVSTELRCDPYLVFPISFTLLIRLKDWS